MKGKLYSPYQISGMSDAQIRKAYSNLRSVANKRIQRLESAGLRSPKVSGFKYPTIAEINQSSKYSMESALADVSVFLRSERTTVTGAKRFINQFRENMIEMGYGDLVESTEDVFDAIDFMDALREEYGNKLFDSGDALDVLQEGERLNIPVDMLVENYDFFKSNLDSLEELKPSKGGKPFSQKRLGYWRKKWNE